MLGGGLVPLTPAQCCRPCLPASLEGVRNVPEGAQPAAILSIGCYTAPGGSGNGLMCDRPHVRLENTLKGFTVYEYDQVHL